MPSIVLVLQWQHAMVQGVTAGSHVWCYLGHDCGQSRGRAGGHDCGQSRPCCKGQDYIIPLLHFAVKKKKKTIFTFSCSIALLRRLYNMQCDNSLFVQYFSRYYSKYSVFHNLLQYIKQRDIPMFIVPLFFNVLIHVKKYKKSAMGATGMKNRASCVLPGTLLV